MSRKRPRSTSRPSSRQAPPRASAAGPGSPPGAGLSPEARAALTQALQTSRPRTASSPSPAAGPAPEVAVPEVAAHEVTADVPPTEAAARARAGGGATTAVEDRPAPMPDGQRERRGVQVTSWSCSAVEEVEPHGLGMTHWVRAPEQGEPSLVRVRFTGRRLGAGEGATSFVRDIAVGPVPAGVGEVAVTARATEIPRGEWEVRAVQLDERGQPDRRAPAAQGRGRTTFAPIVKALAPGVRAYAWPSLVLLGTVAAVLAQWLLSSTRDLPAGRLLAVTLLACVVGAVGAKVYYRLTHRDETGGPLAAGMSIQGFVLAAISTLVLGSLVAGVGIGDALDVTTPGLLTGMAIGRVGCWFGGCCVGRATASRWGLWSSDRVLGVRRIPVQFLESAMTAALAVATLLLVVTGRFDDGGATFVVGLAAYTLGRQALFPLRDIPRTTRWGRPIVTVVMLAAIALAVAVEVTS